MRVTLKDIAAKIGVTKTSVSLALRGSASISPALREKVRRVAGELGYVPDPVLQRLAEYRRPGAPGQSEGVIAWLNHWAKPEQLRRFREFEQYWRGAKLAAGRLGYRLEEFIWPADCPARHAEQRLADRGVLGLLIPPHPPEAMWGEFGWGKFSLMRFGLSVGRVDANLVTADHQRAMVMAVKKIHDLGYRRIGLVYDAGHDDAMGGNLYGGFLWARADLNLKQVPPPLDLGAKHPAGGGQDRLAAWLRRYKPDALLTSVAETPAFLRELGYRVPRDVAVASTSPYDIPVDAGIDQCPHAIGQIAAEMLIKQISLNERGAPADPCRILVESRWRDGKSLPPRKGRR